MNTGKHHSSRRRGEDLDLDLKVHDRAHLLFFTHTLCMNNVIAMFLSVSCMNTRNNLLYFARFCARPTPQNSEGKPTTKNFAGFPNHFSLLC